VFVGVYPCPDTLIAAGGRAMIEAAVLGDINVDVLLPIPAYPAPGGDALTGPIVTRAGGSAANTAIALAKLGVAVKMIGRVGEDDWAAIALRALAEAGVDTSDVQRDARAATGMMFVPVTPDGERTMFGHRGANVHTDPAPIDAALFDGARMLHVSGYALLEAPQREAALRAIDLAERNRVAVSLDVGVLPAANMAGEIRRLLPRLSICVLGVDEARLLVEAEAPSDLLAALLATGVQTVGLKLGADGCLIGDATGAHHLPAFAVETVDTTGAGDAFGAGLIFGRLRGLSLPATGLLANALGSLATTVWGAGPALPGRVEASALLKRQRVDDKERASWIEEVLRVIGD
jgi:ribokinase